MSASPHTDPNAAVTGYRSVRNATVVHAPVARHRGATFGGVLELAEHPQVGAAREAGPDESTEVRMLCLLTWYDFTPQRGSAEVKVSGAWRIERGYTGDVVDALGRP